MLVLVPFTQKEGGGAVEKRNLGFLEKNRAYSGQPEDSLTCHPETNEGSATLRGGYHLQRFGPPHRFPLSASFTP